MDIHGDLGDVTEEDLKAAHQRDLDVQDEFGVKFLTYWFNSQDGQAFCLVEAPNKDALIAAHKRAHGLIPHNLVKADSPTVERFMGNWEENAPDIARHSDHELDTGLRAIMFTDLVGSTEISTRQGDARAMEVLAHHDTIVREALRAHRGREVKHTGDGIFACFSHVSTAVDSALDIQRGFGEPNDANGTEPRVRIGISVGEPVSQHEDLFGAVVNLAARICGHAGAGQIFVSSAVRELSVGKPIRFEDRGPIALKGFDDPVRLFEVPVSPASGGNFE